MTTAIATIGVDAPQPCPLDANEAILSRLSSSHLGDRSLYVGASEVGGCLRLLTWEKLNGKAELNNVGPMLAGKALEGEIVAIIRHLYKGRVSKTGNNQAELKDLLSPLVCHPDGALDGGSTALEIKTASSYIFKKYSASYAAMPPRYQMQVQVEAGLMEADKTLLVLVNRDSLEAVTFTVPFDFDIFRDAQVRAEIAMACKAEGTLPAGEPERAYSCKKCPCKKDCPQATLRMGAAVSYELPLEVALDVELALDRIAEIELKVGPLVDEGKALRESIKESMAPTGIKRHECPAGVASLIEVKGRTTVDSKALKSGYPEVYEAVAKTGEPTISLKIELTEAQS